ncbi:MAG TPA: RNA polymerase subunit sigma, partial [bacterium]|nr:RNA polymerase subunit sigma [bacterium]
RVRWPDRAAFYRAAAGAMRNVLVDYARRRCRLKRGGDRRHESDVVADLPARPDLEDPSTFLQLDEAIEALGKEDERAAVIVRLRFFAGLDIDETAATLAVSRRTVLREWAFARARLFAALRDGDADA